MKNRVLRITKGGAEVVEKAMPEPLGDFVVVKQHYAPNCIEHRVYKTGYYEFHESQDHCGHEGVGEVWKVGPQATGFDVGDRVIVFQGWPCGHCHVCEAGLSPTHCVNLQYPKHVEAVNKSESGGNGFCEYRLVPTSMLHRIPDTLSYKHAAAGNCLIGCTFSAMQDHHIGPEHVCLIGGVGFVGHATLVNLKYRGAKVIVLGRHAKRMATALELGADHVVNPEDDDWLDQVRDLTPNGRGVDYAFECSGYPYYQQRCLDAVKFYGTLILLGYAADEGPDLKWALNTEYGLCWGHKTITSHFDVNMNHRTDLVQALQDPWIQAKVDRLVSHIMPMSNAAEAFDLLNQKQADKVFFQPGL